MEQLEKISTPQSRYNHSVKGQARMIKFDHSPKGRARRIRYNHSAKGRKATERFYAQHEGLGAYKMNRYHRIQDEAGCHSHIDDFHSAYRFLKALETAEIVEV